jgi:hypothetical protein
MMNFAHELSHTFNPSSLDLYGSACNSTGATLLGCTGGVPAPNQLRSAVYPDPYHRDIYGWLGPKLTADASVAGYNYVVSAVDNPWGENEILTVQKGDEALTFELRGLWTDYDNQRPGGLYAWYSRLNASGKPYDVPSVTGSCSSDKTVFTLAPGAGCVLNPNHGSSRGRVQSLVAPGEYLMQWPNGGATTFLISKVEFPDNTYYYHISWDGEFDNARQCGMPATPSLTYNTYTFDAGEGRGYAGGGDWAPNEYKGECAAHEWVVGVSSSPSGNRSHSLLCASKSVPANLPWSQSTLSVNGQNDGYGVDAQHMCGDWDPGYYKGECARNQVLTGLSQDPNGGALNHLRCSPTNGKRAVNCRSLPFPANNNQEAPGSGFDWAYGYYKAECSQGGAVAGVSRSPATGAIHAILCCDFV